MSKAIRTILKIIAVDNFIAEISNGYDITLKILDLTNQDKMLLGICNHSTTSQNNISIDINENLKNWQFKQLSPQGRTEKLTVNETGQNFTINVAKELKCLETSFILAARG